MREVNVDIQNYLKSRSNMFTLDFHKVMRRASSTLGRGGIFGITTFHDLRYEDAYLRTQQQGIEVHNLGNAFYVPSYDLLVVKCQRVMTQQGDLDVIGVREFHHIPERMTLDDTLKAVEDEGALSDVPNPFHRRGLGSFMEKNRVYLERVQGITVYSGEGAFSLTYNTLCRGRDKPNEKALEFYNVNKPLFPHLGAITASNGSLIRHIGTNFTVMLMPSEYQTLNHSEDVVAAFREALHATTPEKARRKPLVFGSLRHQCAVLIDHNPISYKLKGIPNVHLDSLFTKK